MNEQRTIIYELLGILKKNGMTQEQAQHSIYEMQMAGVGFFLLPRSLASRIADLGKKEVATREGQD